MRAEDLRRLLREEDLRELGTRLGKGGDLSGLFFRMVRSLGPYAAPFRLEPEEALALAGRAAGIARAILAEAGRVHPDRDIALADAASDRWLVRAAARRELERGGVWIDARIVGSLAGAAEEPLDGRHPRWRDGSIACQALLVAARERAQAPTVEAYQQAAERARHGDVEAEAAARRHLLRLQPDFYANALSCGFGAREARAAALIARERLAGRAAGADGFALAAAAVMTLPMGARRTLSAPVPFRARKIVDARRGLAPIKDQAGDIAQAMRTLNDWRARALGVEARDSSVRRLGAAAIGAIYGFSWGWQRPKAVSVTGPRLAARRNAAGEIMIDGLRPVRLSETSSAKLDGLALDGAHARLRQLADDGRETSENRRRYEMLHEALGSGLRGLDATRWSFARWLDASGERPSPAELADGARLWWAAPNMGWPAVCSAAGTRGRVVTCRALADSVGRLVGYAGFDVLSREFHGESLYALYDLSGRRAGRLTPVEGGGRAILGESRLAFITAPAKIPLAAS